MIGCYRLMYLRHMERAGHSTICLNPITPNSRERFIFIWLLTAQVGLLQKALLHQVEEKKQAAAEIRPLLVSQRIVGVSLPESGFGRCGRYRGNDSDGDH